MDRGLPQSDRPHASLGRQAFSLAEIVMVLAISGLMAAVAIPRLGSATARYQLDYAAKRVASDLERARTNARMASAAQTVTFNLTTNQYVVTGPGTSGTTVNMAADPYRVKIASTSFGSPAVATFDAYGLPAAGGTIVLSAGGRTRTVTLNAASGRATWQ